MLYQVTRDYEIPDGGITEQFRLNSYANFSMDLINIVRVDNKLIKIYDYSEYQGDKEFEEEIDVIDDDGKTIKAMKKITRNVLSFTCLISNNDKVVKNGKYKAVKEKRILPKIDTPELYEHVQDIQDKPNQPKKEKKPPKPPKAPLEDLVPIKDDKLIKG